MKKIRDFPAFGFSLHGKYAADISGNLSDKKKGQFLDSKRYFFPVFLECK